VHLNVMQMLQLIKKLEYGVNGAAVYESMGWKKQIAWYQQNNAGMFIIFWYRIY
jgi:hypothetical protein